MASGLNEFIRCFLLAILIICILNTQQVSYALYLFILKIAHRRLFNWPERDILVFEPMLGTDFKFSCYVMIEYCLYGFKGRIIRRNMTDYNKTLISNVFTFCPTPSIAFRCFWIAVQRKYLDNSLPTMDCVVLLEKRDGFYMGSGTVKLFTNKFSKIF